MPSAHPRDRDRLRSGTLAIRCTVASAAAAATDRASTRPARQIKYLKRKAIKKVDEGGDGGRPADPTPRPRARRAAAPIKVVSRKQKQRQGNSRASSARGTRTATPRRRAVQCQARPRSTRRKKVKRPDPARTARKSRRRCSRRRTRSPSATSRTSSPNRPLGSSLGRERQRTRRAPARVGRASGTRRTAPRAELGAVRRLDNQSLAAGTHRSGPSSTRRLGGAAAAIPRLRSTRSTPEGGRLRRRRGAGRPAVSAIARRSRSGRAQRAVLGAAPRPEARSRASWARPRSCHADRHGARVTPAASPGCRRPGEAGVRPRSSPTPWPPVEIQNGGRRSAFHAVAAGLPAQHRRTEAAMRGPGPRIRDPDRGADQFAAQGRRSDRDHRDKLAYSNAGPLAARRGTSRPRAVHSLPRSPRRLAEVPTAICPPVARQRRRGPRTPASAT